MCFPKKRNAYTRFFHKLLYLQRVAQEKFIVILPILILQQAMVLRWLIALALVSAGWNFINFTQHCSIIQKLIIFLFQKHCVAKVLIYAHPHLACDSCNIMLPKKWS